MLSHPHDHEGAQGGTDQSSEEAEHDDRQSMFPFVKKEQRFETPTHHDATKGKSQKATDQRDLVRWTKIRAIVTGALAFATFIVAFVSVWGGRETPPDSLRPPARKPIPPSMPNIGNSAPMSALFSLASGYRPILVAAHLTLST